MVLFISVFVIVLLLLNMKYVSTNHWKAENNVWKFNFVPDDIEFANFGSSHGELSFIYNDYPEYTTFNFGLKAQTFFWDYGILQQYIDKFAPKAVVILPVSYFWITRRSLDYSGLRLRYYRFLEKDYFDEWNPLELLQYSKFPVLTSGKDIFNCVWDVPSSEIDIFNERTTFLTEDEMLEYCQKRFRDVTLPEDEKGEEGYKQNFAEICQLVKLCLDNDLQPVLVTTPIVTQLNDMYEDYGNFFETFYNFIAEVQAQFPGVPYFDYSHDTDFSPKFELFTDGDHLNVYGARAFTARVVADLQNAGLLK